jgi:hypothetical protein
VFTHELLTKHGIVHWLDYGSLLGAVRGGELIPWDNDVDFGFLGSDLRGAPPLPNFGSSGVYASGRRLSLLTLARH